MQAAFVQVALFIVLSTRVRKVSLPLSMKTWKEYVPYKVPISDTSPLASVIWVAFRAGMSCNLDTLRVWILTVALGRGPPVCPLIT